LGANEKFIIVQQLVFATNNLHKLEEVAAKLHDRVQILSLNDINCTDEIAETGTTFRQNASIKSNHIYEKYKINCFADDSGLEIDALNGEPGVYSARYAGRQGDDIANTAKVLMDLGASTNRSARFRTVISLIWNDSEHFFEGVIEGTIRNTTSGAGGFGYDPIFEPHGYTVTFAEMTLAEKNSISHRSIAIEKLIDFLDRN